jgi:hypothetical protein
MVVVARPVKRWYVEEVVAICKEIATQARMTRRYIAWRTRHTHDHRLRKLVKRANVPDAALVQARIRR